MLADEYNLTHKPSYNREERQETLGSSYRNGPFGTRQSPSYLSESDTEKFNYCLKRGHWKRECPLLQGGDKKGLNSHKWDPVKGAGCAAPVRKWNRTGEVVQVNATVPAEGSGCEVPDHSGQGQCVSESADGQVGEGYAPFITDGFISFVGCSEKKPVRILRDTGATETFVSECVLPFSLQSSTGECVLIRGMGMQTMSVPLHKIVLSSDLVQGEVIVGVRPELPVPGVHVILGNILAGARVWPSGPAPPVRSIEPIEANKQGDWVTEVPKDCTAGVTGAKSRAQSGRGSNRISGLKCEKKSGLIGWCVFFHFFGIFLSGDKVFRAIGNVLFTTRLSLVIVLKCTFRFFFQEHTGRTTSFFLGAVFGVVIGWPIVGVDFKIFGFMLLYSGFTPHVKGRSIVHGLMRGRTLGMGCAGMGLAC